MDETAKALQSIEDRQQQLAARLRHAREYLGLSQQFVEQYTGISRVAISALENGKRKVDALELERLASLYKYPVSYFLEGGFTEPAVVQALAREANELTEHDRDQVLQFARFLKAFGSARPVTPGRDHVPPDSRVD